MYVYNIDNKFDWNNPSWTPDEKYSEYFNRLLISRKSTMTPMDVLTILEGLTIKFNPNPYFETIEKNRAELIKEYLPLFEKFKKEPPKKLDDKNYTAYVYYQKYIEDEKGGGIDQFAMDAFPMEAIFITRY